MIDTHINFGNVLDQYRQPATTGHTPAGNGYSPVLRARREAIATAAMAAIIQSGDPTEDSCAEAAVRFADALLSELRK